MKITWSSRAAFLVRLLLAGVFLWAGAQKARNPQLFTLDLEAYRLLPGQSVLPIAYYLPWLEIATGLSLLVPALRRAALGLSIVLLLVFTSMLSIAWARGLFDPVRLFRRRRQRLDRFGAGGRTQHRSHRRRGLAGPPADPKAPGVANQPGPVTLRPFNQWGVLPLRAAPCLEAAAADISGPSATARPRRASINSSMVALMPGK